MLACKVVDVERERSDSLETNAMLSNSCNEEGKFCKWRSMTGLPNKVDLHELKNCKQCFVKGAKI